MKRLLISIASGAAVATAGSAAAFFLIGPDRIWKEIAGPADLGPVDFDELVRSRTSNDALAASADTMPDFTEIELPHYGLSPADLMTRLDAVLRRRSFGEDATRVDDRSDPARRRYVVRTPTLRFPDTLSAEARPFPEGTGLMLYSRSQLGKSDLGANRKRLKRIATMLVDEVD